MFCRQHFLPLLLAKSALFLFSFSNRFFGLLFLLLLCFFFVFGFLSFDIFLGTHVHCSVNVPSNVKKKIDVIKASKTTLRLADRFVELKRYSKFAPNCCKKINCLSKHRDPTTYFLWVLSLSYNICLIVNKHDRIFIWN